MWAPTRVIFKGLVSVALLAGHSSVQVKGRFTSPTCGRAGSANSGWLRNRESLVHKCETNPFQNLLSPIPIVFFMFPTPFRFSCVVKATEDRRFFSFEKRTLSLDRKDRCQVCDEGIRIVAPTSLPPRDKLQESPR